jgi:hypothetical protein
MKKDKKNRSGSISGGGTKTNNKGDRHQTSQPGAPNKSNRQTGGHRKDDSDGAEKNTTKKGPNAV